MIITDTVFILGAGASIPYGYPSSQELKKYIVEIFIKKFEKIYNRSYERQLYHNESLRNEISQLIRKFSNDPHPFIDLFISRNNKYLEAGKLAIILSIFHYEINSRTPGNLLGANRNQDWFCYIWEEMTQDLKRPYDYAYFKENKVTFITFNYDRSLEHFFYNSPCR